MRPSRGSAAASVRYRRRPGELIVTERGTIKRPEGWSEFLAPLTILGSASLASLASAMRSIDRNSEEVHPGLVEWPRQTVEITTAATVGEGEQYVPHPIKLALTYGGILYLTVQYFAAESPSNGEAEFGPSIRALVEHRGARVARFWSYEDDGWDYYGVDIDISKRGRTVLDAFSLGSDLITLCETLKSGNFSPDSVLDVLRVGRVAVLIGQYESRWLEAKTAAYDLNSEAEAIEFAQDVTRFANSEHGGLLVLGLRTKKDGVGDRLVAVRPLSSRPPVARYMNVLDRRVFPPIDGLQVEAVPASPTDSGHLLVVHVPTQPEESKPFLVTGAIVSGKVEGAFISIVRRREEYSIPISAPSIHSLLAVGRALLRRGELPGRSTVEGAEATSTSTSSE